MTVDDWTVLSDGTIAFVRGHDYYVDVIRPDGRAQSGAKLPFDWKRLTDADKQHLIDSARAAISQSQAATTKDNAPTASSEDRGRNEMSATMAIMAMSRGDAASGNTSSRPLKLQPPTTEFVPLSEIGDYYLATRRSAAFLCRSDS